MKSLVLSWILVCGAWAAQPTSITTPRRVAGDLVFGKTVVFESQVLPAPGAATAVTFTVDNAIAYGPFAISSDGTARVSLTAITGPHTITARFLGTPDFAPSTSTGLSYNVVKAPTRMEIAADPAQIRQVIEIHAAVYVMSDTGFAVGAVDFFADGVPIPECTTLDIANLAAICKTAFPNLGSVVVTAKFNGDPNTLPVSVTCKIDVRKAVTLPVFATDPINPVYAGRLLLNALIQGAPNLPPPTGTVAFSEGQTPLGSATVDRDARAGISPVFNAGVHNISIAYSGDQFYQPAELPSPYPVNVARAKPLLTVWAPPAQLGQTITVKASVSPLSAGGKFTFEGIAGCAGLSADRGFNTCDIAVSKLGDMSIPVNYSGDDNTLPAATPLIVSVSKVKPGFYAAFAPDNPVYGDSVALSGLVLGGPGVAKPSGTVTFSEGGAPLAAPAVLDPATGRVGLQLPFAVGPHTILVAYSGDANHETPGAIELKFTIGKAPAGIALSSTAAQIDQLVTITAALSSPRATGAVNFAPISSCSNVPLQNGTAVCKTTFSKMGDVTITASYNGDANTESGAASIQLRVGKAAAAVYVAFSPPTPVTGQPVEVNALVTGGQGIAAPVGSVMFSGGASPPSVVPLTADGKASWTVVLQAGARPVTVSYGGDANYGSAQDSTNIPVAKCPTRTTLAAPAGGSFTASVVALAPGGGAPTGIVRFVRGGASLGVASLNASGAASISSTDAGDVTAEYLGDANFIGSISTSLSVAAPRSAASLTVVANPPAVVYGEPVALTAQLPAGASGTVQFAEGATSLGARPASSSGAVTLALPTLPAGVHTIVASWPGDSNWTAVAAQTTVVVNKAGTATVLALATGMAVAAVTVSAPGAGIPSGSVRFIDPVGNTLLANAPVAGGTASAALPNATQVVALYTGDDNFLGSSSSPASTLVVMNAASYTATAFAADEIVALFGPGLDTAGPVKVTDSAGVVRNADVLYSMPAQASIVLPANLAAGPATIAIGRLAGQVNIAPTAPGLFTQDATGAGLPAGQALHVRPDGSVETGAVDDITFSEGDSVYLVLYGTGIRHRAALPACKIAGRFTDVLFAGPQSAYPGLDQVNILVPPELKASGRADVILTIDGVVTNTVTVTFR